MMNGNSWFTLNSPTTVRYYTMAEALGEDTHLFATATAWAACSTLIGAGVEGMMAILCSLHLHREVPALAEGQATIVLTKG